MTDIEITRHGKWEVQIDGVVFSSHNEPKEGYENLLEQIKLNPDKQVRLVPNFYITGSFTEDPFTLTDAEIEQHLKGLPLFEGENEYQYVLFEMDNTGIKNIRDVKTLIP